MDSPVGNNYKSFDPDWYLKTYYGTASGEEEEGDFLKLTLDSLHSVFNSGIINGHSLLDIGTGPTIHSVISASRYVQDIYLSDYAEQNIKILQSWWKGDSIYEEDIFKYILGKENNGEGIADRNSALKKKIKNIVGIDVTLQNPILADDVPKVYDVVISSLCLEAASKTKEEYIKSVHHIKPLINKGGFFILIGVLNQTFYRVGEIKFVCAKLSKEDLKCIYKDAGFEILTWTDLDLHNKDYLQHQSETEYSDFESAFVMAAKIL